MKELEDPATRIVNMRDIFHTTMENWKNQPPGMQIQGWDNFNNFVGGFRTNEFSVFCGPTGKGKTTWLANATARLADNGIKSLVYSVETGHEDWLKRVISVWQSYDLNAVDKVSDEKYREIYTNSIDKVGNGFLYFATYDNRLPIEQLKHDIQYSRSVHETKIIFVDNINFILDVKKSQDMILEMDRIIHELIILCKQIDVHIVMVMHPRKPDANKDLVVLHEFDIKGSSTSVQEAQNVFLFNHPTEKQISDSIGSYNELNKFDRILTIQKMRRRGKFAGTKIIYKNENSRYYEKGVL